MHNFISLVTFAAAFALLAPSSVVVARLGKTRKCPLPRKRMAWQDYTPEQQEEYLNAVIQLKHHDGSNGILPYDDFVRIHAQNVPNAHSDQREGITNYRFVVWHRWFIW